MASEVDICNRALQRLGAEPITNLTDDTVRARECNRAYAILRDAELRSHPWNFARTRAALAALTTTPAFEWDLEYQMPSGMLLLGRFDQNFAYEIEGRKILTNELAPLNMVYYQRVEDTLQFDPLFVEALGARIAHEICEKVTQSTTKRQLAKDDYKDIVAEARRVNAIERLPENDPEDEWLAVRR